MQKDKIITTIAGAVVLFVVLSVSFFIFGRGSNKNIKINNNDTVKKEVVDVKKIETDDHVLGDANAPVKIIFYGDFDCPFSANFYSTLNKTREEYKEKVAVVFRHYPLRTHSLALPAALASECASEQGKFWEIVDKLFDSKRNGKLTVEQIDVIAGEVGLDVDSFKTCVTAEKFKDKIQNDWQAGKNADIIGTPGVFINNQQLSGDIPYENYKDQNGVEQDGLKSVIEKILQNK